MFVFDLRLHLSRISLAVFVLLLFGGDHFATAQTPEAPVGADASDEGRWVETEMPIEDYNRARKAADRKPIRLKNGKNTVTIQYHQPVERGGGFPTKLTSRSVPFVAAPSPSKQVAKATDGTTVISGVDFDKNGSLTGTYNVPADAHGAVGGTYICHVVNVSFGCHKKSDQTSVTNYPKDLKSFFGFSTTDDSELFDPRIAYDPRADRWVVLVLHVIDNGNSQDDKSEIFIAASDGNDPSGPWTKQKFDMNQAISDKCWFDYPSLALDEEAVYVTGNYFYFKSQSEEGFCDDRLVIFDQNNIYSSTSSTTPKHVVDPNGTDFDATITPAFIYGSNSSGSVGDPAGSVGTWVFGYSGLQSNLDPDDNGWFVTRVDDPLSSSPSFTTNFVIWGNVDSNIGSDLPDADQKDTSDKIETNDRRALDFVWRDNTLWGTTTVEGSGDNANQATAHYGQIDVSTLGSPSPVSNSYLGGEDIESGAHTYFPSVVVDANGNAAFGFSLSASGTYAGAYLIARTASGTLLDTKLAQDGIDSYYRNFGGGNRWGDYSATVIDPSDGSFWTINKVAISEGSCTNGDCGRWGTYLTKFPTSTALPVELAAFNATRDGQTAVLTWETASETNNAGFRVEHQGPERSTWAEEAFVEGSGSTSSPQQYRHWIENLDSGVHQFRLIQVDNDGTTTKEGPIDVAIRPEGRYALQAPRPNPTTGDAQLRLSVRNEQAVRASLYNTLGQKVRTLARTTVKPAAPLPIQVEGRDLASGVYFVRVEGETFMATRKLTIAQ